MCVLPHYPLGAVWLAACLFLYALILWRYPCSWLFFIPALLPVLDLARWTGWFFLDEFDLFVLITLAVNLLRGPKQEEAQSLPSKANWFIGLFALSYAASTLIGLLPLQGYDANALSNYYSDYNSLRVSKGFFWALALLPLLKQELGDFNRIRKFFLPGMFAGLFGVAMVAIWERAVFPGLFNFSDDFRITATFSGMHIGGAYIDVYLAMALPLLVSCFLFWRSKLVRFTGMILFALGLYTLWVTFSRAVYFAFGLSALMLFIGLAYKCTCRKALFITALVFVAVTSMAAVPLVQTPYIQRRFARTAEDIKANLAHWDQAKEMMDSNWTTALFGMGLGAYPRTYFCKSSEKVRPIPYKYVTEGDNMFLRLGSEHSLFMGQRIRLLPNRQYTLRLDLRSTDDKAALTIHVCEKSLLYSFRCKTLVEKVESRGGTWGHHELSFSSGNLGQGSFWHRRPVEFALQNARRHTMVEVDNVELIDEQGTNLIENGDFSKGNDRWFFNIDDYRNWHIFNLWGNLFFEQGWIGFIVFIVLLLYVFNGLALKSSRGDLFSLLLLSSLIGALAVGLTDSLIDSPRIAMLFFFIMFVSILHSNILPPRAALAVRN
jgi:hypothetical protein